MDVIVDELKKNNINIDIETLAEHIQYILGNYRDCYNESVERLNREELILDVFSRNECKHLRSGNGLLDTCLSNESYFQRRYSTSGRPFSCTCVEERWKS